MKKSAAFPAFLALLAAATSSCGAKETPVATAPARAQDARPDAAPSSAWIDLRLRDGILPPESSQPAPAEAPAIALPDEDAARLLARLPALAPAPAPPAAPTLANTPLPPAGAVVQSSFPPPDAHTPPAAAARQSNAAPAPVPLSVVRRAPEGEVQLAPNLRVTFSHPMVAVTAQSQQNAANVPVRITPAPPGAWRWLGTQTLLFEPETRFAQATAYRVDIPAGTRAATGHTLDSAVSWSFATPPPKVVSRWPNEWLQGKPQPRQPLMIAVFDQRVDPAAVLPAIRVRAGGTLHPLRLLATDEIAGLARMSRDPDFQDSIDAELKNLLDEALPGHAVAFTVAAPLPADAEVTVDIGPGTPSAEGPRTQAEALGFSFRTIGPLRVLASNCAPDKPCTPGADWAVSFSDLLDPGSISAEQIRVEPALPYLHIDFSKNQLRIDNNSKARTRYTVTLPVDLADVNGQALGARAPITFTVGPEPPSLSGPERMMVLDPAADRPTVEVYSTNIPALSVRLYAVTPRDWPAYQAYLNALDGNTPLPPPGKLVARSRVTVDSEPDAGQQIRIELGPALGNGPGHVLAIVEPASWPAAGPAGPEGKDQPKKPVVRVWVQKTDIGLAAFTGNDEVAGWATSLDTAAALPGVNLRILPDRGPSARTDAQGLARLSMPRGERNEPRLLVAQRGRDIAFLPEGEFRSDVSFTRYEGSSLLWYVFDDRQTYRPGERVHVKGWLRVEGQDGNLVRPRDATTRVSYVLEDAKDVELARGEVPVNDAGGFHMALSLPRDVNLGEASLALQARGPGGALGDEQHGFDIEEFRRPELEVGVRASDAPRLVGEPIELTVKARYYTGERVGRAPVRWRITASPSTFEPQGWDGFGFGAQWPWWGWVNDIGDSPEPVRQEHAATTSAGGAHVLRMDVRRANPLWAVVVKAEAEIEDVNRQAWAARSSVVVHPSALYVGLAVDRAGSTDEVENVRAGEPLRIRAVVVDHDGKAVAGRDVRVRAERMVWSRQTRHRHRGKQAEVVDAQTCTQTSARAPVTCTFDTGEGDWYRITARVTDAKGRPSESQILVQILPPPDPDDQPDDQADDGDTLPSDVVLSADQDTYRPGDTARIQVQVPFFPAEGILVLDHVGMGETRRFHVNGPVTTLEVPITESHVPQVHVHVTLVGAKPAFDVDDLPAGVRPEQLPREPVHSNGELTLEVSPEHRRLAVDIAPARAEVAPGERTELAIHVRDAGGKPAAGAEVAVVVVDQAILDLSRYSLDDPLETFHPERGAVVATHHLREAVVLAPLEFELPDGTILGRGVSMSSYGYGSGAGGMVGRGSGSGAPLDVRANLDPLALFAPEVRTDAHGRARVPLTLPDGLTRYRIMAVAVHGDRQFGQGESDITARKSLMVRPSPPRFARLGDAFELPVVVHNHTGEDRTVDVAARARGLRLPAGAGRRVTVAAGARVELRLPAVAATMGEARVQIAAVAGAHADAAEIVIPVHAPLTTEVSATYGEIADGGAIRQPVAVPAGAHPALGGLEITTASTQLQALTDALLYLVEYPYGCSEQIASRVLAVTALGHVLDAFAVEGLPPPAAIRAAVARDIEALAARQNPDGGFGLWRGGTPSSLFASVHVAYALQQAHARGTDRAGGRAGGRAAVPARVLAAARVYLRDIEKHIPEDYPAAARHAVIAYALLVRARMGDGAPARARALVREAGMAALSLETAGWLLGALARVPGADAERAALIGHLNNRVSETAAGAHFVDRYSEGAHLILHGDRRADAVILDALLAVRPNSDLIPKLARDLLGGRARGRWRSTQDNAFALVALARYLDTHEQAAPAFVARAWLGDRFAGEHRFQGRTSEQYRIDIPMAHLAGRAAGPGDVAGDVIVHKDGPGRLYYRIAMRHTPAAPMVAADDRGFAVTRTYEAVDNPADVRCDADGTWRIRAGARVRVRVQLLAPARRHHVALIAPLPAGLEAMNPALAVTGSAPPAADEGGMGTSSGWWQRTWYEHENLRDDRAEAFASTLQAGAHEYTFMARATTPGRFVTPPARAEEMYTPETSGRSATDRVRIE